MSTLLLFVGFGGLIAGGVLLKIARMTTLYSSVPSSTIAGAESRGLVQISGVARAAEGAPRLDPEGTPCIWYRVIRVSDTEDGERESIEGGPPADPAAVDTILLEDRTGRCSMVLRGHSSRVMDRKVWKTEGLTQLVILRITDGTQMYAVGRVEKLAHRERGATHRIHWDSRPPGGYSHRSLETMAKDVPWMNKWGIGLLVLGAPSLAYGLWLSFGPMFE